MGGGGEGKGVGGGGGKGKEGEPRKKFLSPFPGMFHAQPRKSAQPMRFYKKFSVQLTSRHDDELVPSFVRHLRYRSRTQINTRIHVYTHIYNDLNKHDV